MKRINILLFAGLLLTACQPKLNLPVASENNINLNTLLTLEVGENKVYLQDFILNIADIDSVTSSSEKLKVQVSTDKTTALLTVGKDMEQMIDLKIWLKGVPFSVPCRKTDKIDFHFTFDAHGKTYKKVQIAGQMNDWTPSRMPDLKLNDKNLYEITLNLSPGSYLYQMALDGDQNHDPNNPDKVDNGFGKFNSILQIPGKNDSFPALTTDKFDKKSIYLGVQNKVNEVFAYWQNYRLPLTFVKTNPGELEIRIPLEAEKSDRSFIRVWASNSYGVSNDILVPLQHGKVIDKASEINRSDKYSQIMYFMLVD